MRDERCKMRGKLLLSSHEPSYTLDTHLTGGIFLNFLCDTTWALSTCSSDMTATPLIEK
jgi:hypothetical protein